ncbi:protein kinase domain-containing protein [Ferrimonas marina]|uniref:Non-specific serine/threonine protein kinase n=1 Tax=Ferrimonas marina TaxID=299255 RepID=A0A1M5ZLH6_9GAMM|nr:protein kinase [Ferrimonas marina]SHI24988.1 non-specific serine/threonine protein kinase [Ferrimonas marina]
MTNQPGLQHFYIAEEQSIYLLKQDDANKLRQWVALCREQLHRLGYRRVHYVGKGIFGFVFAGFSDQHEQVFKFSRRTLPGQLQARLEEEAEILAMLDHPHIPAFSHFVRASGQPILQMARAPGQDLSQLARQRGPLPVVDLVPIAAQLAELLLYLRQLPRPVVHGDIKPSNLMYDPERRFLSLVDWGSAVLAQRDAQGDAVNSSLGLYEGDQGSNARMGDIYFIGQDQLDGTPSSPRFDEQGAAATLYALASGQSSRFGHRIRPARSLGLPQPLAEILDAMLSEDPTLRQQGGDHFLSTLPASRHWLLLPPPDSPVRPLLPVWHQPGDRPVESVAYSSRKSFLRDHQQAPLAKEREKDLQIAHYYRDFLNGMGDNEKAFVVAVNQLGHYPLLGGLALHWRDGGVEIDSSLNLQDPKLKAPFAQAVNNLVMLAQAQQPNQDQAVFKACFFNARDTLHLERSGPEERFSLPADAQLPFEVSPAPELEDKSRLHSYFEDGKDPDELLTLPQGILNELGRLNLIHHTGCIIFEVLPDHMKIHSYLRLLNPRKQAEFAATLGRILAQVDQITDLGVSGFMKLPYKNTRRFEHQAQQNSRFYPKDPKRQGWSETVQP